VLLQPDTPLVVAGIGTGLAGIGFGNASVAFLLAPQAAVPWHLRGAVTSSTQFARTIGGAVGVALLGALLNARLQAVALPAGTGQAAPEVDAMVSALLNPATRAALPPPMVEVLALAMANGLHWIYVALLALATAGFVQVAVFGRSLPRARPETRTESRSDAATAPAARALEPAYSAQPE
jgi:hypothetical protein